MAPPPSRTWFVPPTSSALRLFAPNVFGVAPKTTRERRVRPNQEPPMIAWTIYVTFGGALLLFFLPHVLARWMALLSAVAGFGISVAAFFSTANQGGFETIVRLPWIRSLGFEYHLAADGISLTMCLVTGLTAVSAVLFSWDVEERPNEFFFWLLLVVGGSYGVFLSADLFLL